MSSTTRLGETIYWLGCVATMPLAFCALHAAAALIGFFGGTIDPAETESFAESTAALAALFWLAGRIARSVLGGS
jgi:hypothetical protein